MLESLRQAWIKAMENVSVELMINQEGFLLVRWKYVCLIISAQRNIQIKAIIQPQIEAESQGD